MKRKAYKRAVSKAKRKFDEKRYDNLEGLIRNSKKWWKAVGKLGVVGRNAKAKAVSRVVNEVGEVKEGEEAVGVWKRHFERIMNSEVGAEEYRGLENSEAASQFRLLYEDIASERRSGAGIEGTEEEGGGRKRWFDCGNGQL